MTINDHDKAERWDHLLRLLSSPAVQDAQIFHLSNMRRATMILLASREELPEALARELSTYMARLDMLYMEAKGGFDDAQGVLNMINEYITGSLVAELRQADTFEEDSHNF